MDSQTLLPLRDTSILGLFDLVHDLGNRPDLDGPIAFPPRLRAELHLDRAVFAYLAVLQFEPAVVVVVPLVHDAVADDHILAVAELVCFDIGARLSIRAESARGDA